MARPLETYRKKRRFGVTPEPPPPRKLTRRRGLPTFMIHKHDATRLHYDLRLEMDGALASWAVPKGPSYDPAAKRLAVQTEDHPLEYGGFEGRIPDGEYGGGDSLIWDRGTYDSVPPGQASQQRKKGHLLVELSGEKLRGRWHLIRTRQPAGARKEQWLLFKARDAQADPAYDVVADRPESVVSQRRITRGPETRKRLESAHPAPLELLASVWPPMLAKATRPGELVSEGRILEVKYDGFRALAALSGGQLTLQSRNGLDLSQRFPPVAAGLRRLVVAEAVLDGEIVALDAKGRSRFEGLAQPDADLRYAVFDLLWLDGEDLRRRPIEDRRELLESLLSNPPPPVQLAERLDLAVGDALGRARKRGWEGVIAKRPGSAYAAGRSSDWLKLKVVAEQELAVLGYTPIRSGLPQIGALLVGSREGPSYRLAGKVGTGFDASTRRELWAKLEAQRIDAPPWRERIKDARWVKPQLVAQVAFSEWTRAGRLRHPRFLGLRMDRSAEECVREPAT